MPCYLLNGFIIMNVTFFNCHNLGGFILNQPQENVMESC